MKVIYNVTVSVDSHKSDEWLKWMKEIHIPDVMKTGVFLESKISRVLAEEEGGITWAIQYLCPSMAEYERYQKEFAPALQADHTRLYGRFTAAFRTLLEVHEDFKHER